MPQVSSKVCTVLEDLSIPEPAIREGLEKIDLDGRFQRLGKHCEVILDVAHNHDSANNLARNLAANSNDHRTIAVFSGAR
jgi:folylpolyglutamate synthase/dihydropteroate synthase